MAGPTDLQTQAQYYLFKIMKGTVTNVNVLAEINNCRSMKQPGYQAWYRAANCVDPQDLQSRFGK